MCVYIYIYVHTHIYISHIYIHIYIIYICNDMVSFDINITWYYIWYSWSSPGRRWRSRPRIEQNLTAEGNFNPSRVELGTLGMLYSRNRGFDRPLFEGTYCTFTTHVEEFLASWPSQFASWPSQLPFKFARLAHHDEYGLCSLPWLGNEQI